MSEQLIKKEKYKFEDYIRMFAGESFYFVFSDIFLEHYKELGVLSVQDSKNWISFLPKNSKQKTLEKGKNLFTNKKLFDRYNKDFYNYMEESSKYFESILRKEIIGAEETKIFLDLTSKHFFYTDLIDQEKMAISTSQFGKLKLDGRAYLNKILFEGNGYLRSFIKKISNQTNVPESELLSYGVGEIIELVRSKKRIDPDEIKIRNLYFHSKEDRLFGEDSKELAKKFISRHQKISNEIPNRSKLRGIR